MSDLRHQFEFDMVEQGRCTQKMNKAGKSQRLGGKANKGKVLIYGVGVNDSDMPVRFMSGGVSIVCPIYQKWRDMLRRCYCKKSEVKNPTYAGCSVVSEWFRFSEFKRWVEAQRWQGLHLDKDILVAGNKIYSPKFCVFVTKTTNTFLTDRKLHRGDYPLGVSWKLNIGKYQAECSNPFSGKSEYLGVFHTAEEAHLAWRKRKHEISCQLADIQEDIRVANALRSRFAPVTEVLCWS